MRSTTQAGARPDQGVGTGGQALVDALVAGGVSIAFTVPGESFLPVLDALHDAPIRTVATRHEGGAAFMAEAVGQLSGRPAACLATRVVGAANLAIGLHTAFADSSPLVAIVGQVPSAMRGREAFQEVDQVATFGRLCKAATEIDDPADLFDETARLIDLAKAGRPGPVLVAVPEDVLAATVVRRARARPRDGRAGDDLDGPTPEATRAVLDALAMARAPVIIAGAGVIRSDASAALAAFAETVSVPVIASWRRPDVLPNDHPLYLGMSGLGAPSSVRRRAIGADLILALGCRLNTITTFDDAVPAPGARVIHVDASPGRTGRPLPWLALRADASRFLEAALRLATAGAGRPADPAGRAAGNAADRAAYEAASSLPAAPTPDREAAPTRTTGTVDPATVVRALAARLPDRAVVTTDAGNFAAWYARYLRLRAGQRFLGPTSGAMGYGLPAAIGAALTEPARPTIALVGDGGLAMLLAELETAVRERARLTVLVHDNERYGTIRMHQELAAPGRITATELGPIDFAAVARACGASARTVSSDADVAPALEAALAGPGVELVHLRMDRAALSVDRRSAP